MSTARHFFSRTPRYSLNQTDHRVLRFAEMKTRGVSQEAVVRDVSATGLSFAVRLYEGERSAALPDEGDMLKIEFTVPGDQQIACFGTVVRLDAVKAWDPDLGEETYSVVGIQFRHLPAAHARALQTSLKPRTENEADFGWSEARHKHGLTLAGLTLAMGAILLTLATPAEIWIKKLSALI